jgi:hypothetical protein
VVLLQVEDAGEEKEDESRYERGRKESGDDTPVLSLS